MAVKIKTSVLIVIILISTLLIAPNVISESINSNSKNEASNWTVMVYMCGDNNLQGKIKNSINWLEYAGSDDSLKIVVQADYLDLYDGIYRYYVNYDTTNTIVSDVVDILEEQSTGYSKTLSDFVIWATNNYPAEKYCLVLYGHGSGWAGFLRDDTSVDDMKLEELKTAMTTIYSNLGRKIDLISFESCQLGMIEIFYQIRGTVDVCIGSEDIVYDNGFPYHMIYTDLKQNPEMSTEELTQIVMDEYKNYYFYMNLALGAFSNDKIANLVENKFNEFATKLSDHYGIFKRQIKKAIKDTQSYNIGDHVTYYYDMYDFANEIRNQMNLVTGFNKEKADEIKILAEELITEIESATIYTVKFGNGQSHGMSIYIPTEKKDYDPRYENSDLCKNTGWQGFITKCMPRSIQFEFFLRDFPFLSRFIYKFQKLIKD